MLKGARQRRKDIRIVEDHSFVSNFKNTACILDLQETTALSLRKINEIKGLPEKDKSIRIVTRASINAFDFILAISEREVIEELYIAIYRIGKKVINTIKELQDTNNIKHISFLVNDGYPKLQRDAFNLMKSFEGSNWVIRLDNNHTKIILAKTKLNNYVIEGSGNLSINARIEQYVFDNNEEIFNFHKSWIQ